MSTLNLQYDAQADRLLAKLKPSSDNETVQAERDDIVLRLDRAQKLVVSFEIADFRYFFSYLLLDQLFGDDVLRDIAQFQSDAVEKSLRSRVIEVRPFPRSNRRVVNELLRIAA